MTVGKTISVACGALSAALILQAATALYGFTEVRTSVDNMTLDSVPGIEYSGLLGEEIYHLRSIYQHHLVVTDAKDRAAVELSAQQISGRLQQDMHDYEGTIHDDQERAMYQKLATLNEQYQEEWQEVLPVSREGKSQEAAALYFAKTGATVTAINKTLPQLNQGKLKAQKQSSDLILSMADRSLWTLLLICLGSIGMAGVVWFRSMGSVNRQLTETVEVLGESAEQITTAAGQLSKSSQATAEGSSVQAAKIEETSAASSQIYSMAVKTHHSSSQAAGIVMNSQQGFERANVSLGEMVGAMGGIQESSQRISKIIKVIEEIAFQTNILALNAAVEAARAGEAGQGFSVVAEEVRNLAQRCATAAEDTVLLIEDSIKRSDEGKTKVDDLVIALRGITEESGKIKGLVDSINEGSVDQKRAIEQINAAMTQMETFTQSNAAGAEEGAAAAEELSAQASVLNGIVYHLKSLVDSSVKERRQTEWWRTRRPAASVQLMRGKGAATGSRRVETF